MISKINISSLYKQKHEMAQNPSPTLQTFNPDRPNSHNQLFLNQTTIIFDWDDTLLASSHLYHIGLNLQSQTIPEELANQLQQLENQVVCLLTSAKQYAQNVFIITNAEIGWVELSSLKFMPKVHNVLGGIQIISAKSTYRHLTEHTQDIRKPHCWKTYAFDDIIRYDKMSEMNILSIGDSEYERNAIFNSCKTCINCRYKSFKLIERPTIYQLWRQIEMINRNFELIVNYNGNLDMMTTITNIEKQNEQSATTDTVTLPNVPNVKNCESTDTK